MRTRIKICGLTRVEDAAVAVEAGADAVGLVFYRPSPRHVELERAAHIARAVPAFVTLVGLFVNPDPDEVRGVLERIPLGLLQFHGDESPDQCRSYGRAYIKAIRMRTAMDVGAKIQEYGDAAGVLVDSYEPGRPGGTGASFAWDRLPADPGKPLILAGGLTPDNVGAAVAQVRPYAVDVSSGVESAPGVKDAGRIRAFVAAVTAASVQK